MRIVCAATRTDLLRRLSAGLGQTIRALPVRDVAAAVSQYRERFGFAVAHEVDALDEELRTADVVMTFFRWERG
jgi:hypothetical protein